MDSPVVTALVITGIGVPMLFLALAMLCGLMYALTALTRERRGEREGEGKEGYKEGGEEGYDGEAGEQDLARQRAAIVGIALARAEAEGGRPSRPEVKETPSPGRVSPWWTLHHQRQLGRQPHTRKAQ